MARSSTALSDELASRLRGLEGTRRRIERLAALGTVGRLDTERVYESLFLNSLALFETFIEDLFIGLLVTGQGLTTSHNDVRPRTTVSSFKVARELVTGDRRYVDWLPYDFTERRAGVFFTGGRPFSAMPPADKRQIETCDYIRNAIAHKGSKYAKEKFEDNVLAGLLLLVASGLPQAICARS